MQTEREVTTPDPPLFLYEIPIILASLLFPCWVWIEMHTRLRWHGCRRSCPAATTASEVRKTTFPRVPWGILDHRGRFHYITDPASQLGCLKQGQEKACTPCLFPTCMHPFFYSKNSTWLAPAPAPVQDPSYPKDVTQDKNGGGQKNTIPKGHMPSHSQPFGCSAFNTLSFKFLSLEPRALGHSITQKGRAATAAAATGQSLSIGRDWASTTSEMANAALLSAIRGEGGGMSRS